MDALISLRPNVKWSMHNMDYSTIQWLEAIQTPPTEEELNSEVIRLQAAEAAAQQAAETHKQNAISKLSALGLSADEIAALGVK